MSQSPLYFLIAGEASGDLLGAALMRGLKRKVDPSPRFMGIGGPRMRAEGIELLFPQEELAHMGVFELLTHIPHILKRIKETAQALEKAKPEALITIDAPDFSFRVAQRLKEKGIPLIHYVAPTVWAWRAGRAKKIAAFLDHLLTLLPFEPPYFTKEGLSATFVGHPIVESRAGEGDGVRFRARYDIAPDNILITLLPGSRMGEINRLLPIFGQTISKLLATHPKLRVVIPTVPHLSASIRELMRNWPVPALVVESDEEKYDAFAASKMALACSGTVALELALARLPSIIAYRANPLTVCIAKHLVKVKYINLVNLMHNKMVVPECLQEQCTPEILASMLEDYLSNDTLRQKQIEGLGNVAAWLGQGQFVPSERAAETVLKVARDYQTKQKIS